MSGSSDKESEDRVREAAASWYVRLASSEAGESDWRAFEQWLATREHRAAYDRLESALLAVDANRDAIATHLEGQDRPLEEQDRRPAQIIPLRAPRPRLVWLLTGAAAAAAAGVLGIQTLTQPSEIKLAYAAPADRALQVTLPDASVVNLDRGSAVETHFSANNRRVVLTKGEASFAVVHDRSHPFEVDAGGGQIEDVGTEFNVLLEGEELIVTVRQGSVRVAAPQLNPTQVGRGEQLQVGPGAATLANVDPNDAFGWREGQLIYHDASLAQIARDFSRYSPVPVRTADARTGALRFSGVLVIDTPAAMIGRLKGFLPIRSTQSDTEIVLQAR